MKRNVILLAAIAILGVVVFFSCKKSDSNSSSAYSMSATINGTPYNNTGCVAVINGSELTVKAVTNLPYIILTVPNYSGAGNYVITPSSLGNPIPNAAIVDSTSISAPAKSQYGSISITSTSPNITGSFNFSAIVSNLDTAAASYGYVSDTLNITGGSFTAQLLP